MTVLRWTGGGSLAVAVLVREPPPGADLVVTKPGRLSTSECLALGLPQRPGGVRRLEGGRRNRG